MIQFLKMETINPSTFQALANHAIVVQQGRGDIDRYIYQDGEGIASFFGNLFKKAVPMIFPAIKGAAKGAANIIKPHAIKAGKDLLSAGAKRGFEELTNLGEQKLKHKKHKRKPKWQSL